MSVDLGWLFAGAIFVVEGALAALLVALARRVLLRAERREAELRELHRKIGGIWGHG